MVARAIQRERTRSRIAQAAAQLVAERGFDKVLVVDVARAADVSEQTVYNYFPAKQDLVLDRAEEVLDLYREAVVGRGPDTGPAHAIRHLVHADVQWIGAPDLGAARGMFLAQAVLSTTFRRFALEFRARQADAVARALAETDPDLPPLLAHAYAASLIAVAQSVADTVGNHIVDGSSLDDAIAVRTALGEEIDRALDRLDLAFDAIAPRRAGPAHPAYEDTT